MKNVAFLIEYDGTNYAGWQIQQNAKTVQGEIQNALLSITKENCSVIGSGRTDSSVHAYGQVANVILSDDFKIPEDKIPVALNTLLPDNIRIRDAKYVDQDFHARFDALSREYEYNLHFSESVFKQRFSTFYKYPLDRELLISVAEVFYGKHDFTSFSKNNPSTKSYICNVEMCEWEVVSDDAVRFHIRADRFVYGMVRAIVGACLEVASGGKYSSDLIFAIENPDRRNFIKLAPPNGLILKQVIYKNEIFR